VKEKLASLNDRISLRIKLTVMSIALIGLLLTVSSFGTISLLRTYLQENTDTLLTSTAVALADEQPLLLEARLASREVTLPRLPSDYYIAYLDNSGSLLIGLVSSANAKNAVPNLNAFTLEAVIATEGRPFDIDISSKSGYRDLGSWRMVATPLTAASGSLVIALPDVDTASVSLRAETVNGAVDIGKCEMGVWKQQRALKLKTPILEPFTRELARL
jgi:two-component system OmpR family sensor kinase